MWVIQVHTHTQSFLLSHIPSPSPHPHLPPALWLQRFTSQIFIYVSGHLPVLITPHQLLLYLKSPLSLWLCVTESLLCLSLSFTLEAPRSPFSRSCLTVERTLWWRQHAGPLRFPAAWMGCVSDRATTRPSRELRAPSPPRVCHSSPLSCSQGGDDSSEPCCGFNTRPWTFIWSRADITEETGRH